MLLIFFAVLKRQTFCGSSTEHSDPISFSHLSESCLTVPNTSIPLYSNGDGGEEESEITFSWRISLADYEYDIHLGLGPRVEKNITFVSLSNPPVSHELPAYIKYTEGSIGIECKLIGSKLITLKVINIDICQPNL